MTKYRYSRSSTSILFQRLIISGISGKRSDQCSDLLTLQLSSSIVRSKWQTLDRCEVTASCRYLVWGTTRTTTESEVQIRSSPSHSLATWGYVWQDIAGLWQLCDKALWSGSGRVWWVRSRAFDEGQHASTPNGMWGQERDVQSFHEIAVEKDDFLSNKENKQRFIGLLGEHLAMRGCEIAHATGDADVPIVQTAVTVSDTCEAVLVGDDWWVMTSNRTKKWRSPQVHWS